MKTITAHSIQALIDQYELDIKSYSGPRWYVSDAEYEREDEKIKTLQEVIDDLKNLINGF